MKRYIAPQILIVELDAEELMTAVGGSKIVKASLTESFDDENLAAAQEYRNSLWND